MQVIVGYVDRFMCIYIYMYNRLLFLVGLKTASFSELKRESDSRDQMNQDLRFSFIFVSMQYMVNIFVFRKISMYGYISRCKSLTFACPLANNIHVLVAYIHGE